MLFQFALLAATIPFITGCGAVGSTSQASIASHAVQQADQSKIMHVPISDLHASTQLGSDPSEYAGKVVEVSGTVVAFALTENNLYSVTLRDNESDAVCIFDNSISGKLGDGRPIRSGASLTVQGQYQASGLFASNPFTLHGCRIVN